MHSDPIADLLTRLRNGARARHERVSIPFSKLKLSVAELLKKEGYVEDFREIGGAGKPKDHRLEVKLKYDAHKEPILSDVQRVSKPGLRRYFACDSIPKIRGGLGIIILTTSRGLMTDREARKARLGGEAMCAVW
jgi:small subunit ribosomal protein S8